MSWAHGGVQRYLWVIEGYIWVLTETTRLSIPVGPEAGVILEVFREGLPRQGQQAQQVLAPVVPPALPPAVPVVVAGC